MNINTFIDYKQNNFRVNHVQNLGLESPPMPHYHAHDAFELFYLCNGERLYVINGKKYIIKKGDVVLIDIGTIHRTSPTTVPDYERILIHIPKYFLQLNCINFDIIGCFQSNMPLIILPKNEQTHIESMLYNVIDEITTLKIGYEAAVQAYLAQILIQLNRYAKHQPSARRSRENQFHKHISQVVIYINKNYMQPITIDMLTEKFYISSSHLSRTFKKVTGYTIIQYLHITRIRAAKKLLRETNMSISEISEEVGCGSITHFERVFKRAAGYTPGNYRKLNAH